MPQQDLFEKNTKGHSDYNGWDRCMTHGVWLGKMTYPELNAPLHTDENFRQMEDKDHPRGLTSLANIPIGFFKQFSLDHTQ